MAGITTEEFGEGRSLEEVANGQQLCQSGEALVEWKSSELIKDGTPSTSPPYWDSDDDDRVNQEHKKSIYSDTLHRFWKEEHDWGWKKFMELSKLMDGFTDDDTLVIKALVQVIRQRADHLFCCLDNQYRRELVRVYLTNIEEICRRFTEKWRRKLMTLIEDKARWSRCCMSQEKIDTILKAIVKHFFIEKEVTSTLVTDSLYNGLKALKGHIKGKKIEGEYFETEDSAVSFIRIEKEMLALVDDVLPQLERAALETFPSKDENDPQNHTKGNRWKKLEK